MDLIPASAPHWHLLLNHFPSIGTVIALGLLLSSFYLKSKDLERASLVLFVLLAFLAIPTFITGAAAARTMLGVENISGDLIAAHQDAAVFAFIGLMITGWVAWFTLWQYRRFRQPSRWTVPAVLVLGVVTLWLMVETGSFGGDINHPEIRVGEGPAVGAAEASRSASLGSWVISQGWIWPALEAAHFMGMAVLFGVVLLIAVRMFGLAGQVPFSAFHRLLPLGTFGFMINVVTGMLFFLGDSARYVAMTNSFFPKMALIVIGGVAVLYFTMFERPWELKPGDKAPVTAKAVAAVTVVLWAGVLVYGRLLPYLEGG